MQFPLPSHCGDDDVVVLPTHEERVVDVGGSGAEFLLPRGQQHAVINGVVVVTVGVIWVSAAAFQGRTTVPTAVATADARVFVIVAAGRTICRLR